MRRLLNTGYAPRIAIALALGFAAACRDESPPGAETSSERANGSEAVFGEIVRAEDLTGELEIALLEFAADVKRGAVGRAVRDRFGPNLASHGFPEESGALQHEVKWIHRHSWNLERREDRISREAFTASLQGFLDHFSEVDDLRFKVVSATPGTDGETLEATLEFSLVGRDREGRREWVRGRADASASAAAGSGWRVERFLLTQMASMLADRDLFQEVALPAGLGVHIERSERIAERGAELTPLGAAVSDLDRDGLLDLFLAGPDRNFLYLNLGDGTFREAAAELGLDSLGGRQEYAVAPLFLDFDNDGDQDLFIALLGNTTQVLLENRLIPDGQLAFRDISKRAKVTRPANSFSAIAGDVNRDGLPDIYVTSYLENRLDRARGSRNLTQMEGEGVGTPNLLFINQGDGTFRELAGLWEAEDGYRLSLAAQFADMDEDGDLDLLVTNDYGGGSRLYFNEGGRRFAPSGATRGFLDPGYGMGVRVGDYDNDGDLDVHITNMSSVAGARVLERLEQAGAEPPWLARAVAQSSGNTLLENLGGGRFRPVSESAAAFEGGWAWGGGFIDFDNDGWLDLHTPNGFISGPAVGDT